MKEYWININAEISQPVADWIHILCDDVVDVEQLIITNIEPHQCKNRDGTSKHKYHTTIAKVENIVVNYIDGYGVEEI